jgi:hypothetical protein
MSDFLFLTSKYYLTPADSEERRVSSAAVPKENRNPERTDKLINCHKKSNLEN